MIPAKQTVALIDSAIQAAKEEPFRRHLGSSVIGDECARKLWYGWRWTKAEVFDSRMLRLFNRGHLEEKRFVGWLRAAGVEVWEAGESGDMKASMRFAGHLNHFGGTPDAVGRGIPELGTEPFLLEFKTHNKKSFDQLISEGLMRTKWKHFVQCQVCMGELKLSKAVYCAVCKDDDRLNIEIVQYDEREHRRAIARAGEIIWSQVPPARIGKNRAHFACKYCHLNELCWVGGKPEVNCRTCLHSEPARDGSGNWQCNRHGCQLDEKAQRAGCQAYQVSTAFLK